jgi:hypothetical protein
MVKPVPISSGCPHNTFELIGSTRLISPLLTEGYASGDTKKWAEARRRKRSVWKEPQPTIRYKIYYALN